ncbi:hypothetical protein NA57DRAFT_15017, partial [Rhizodiscina lignyota]
QCRNLITLAIETSCDDTAVAILEKHGANTSPRPPQRATLHFNEKLTSNNTIYKGIHPLVALESHQRNLAVLVNQALARLPSADLDDGRDPVFSTGRTVSVHNAKSGKMESRKCPDFISVTRGPGMRSNLATGLDMAKGLAVAWQIPIVGVHHMQAHALTPRLMSALEAEYSSDDHSSPAFPFLSLLVSGGHTLLVHSERLTEHRVLADSDMAVGSAIDKIARLVLPPEIISSSLSTMYGAVLERFAFPNGLSYDYAPPASKAVEDRRRGNELWPWSFSLPLNETSGGQKKYSMEFSFSGTVSAVERFMKYDQQSETVKSLRTEDVSYAERQALARESMRVCFEHLASRVTLALDSMKTPMSTLVVSGGVASNVFLRHILAEWLTVRGYPDVKLSCPPPALCTDNAAMIAWAGCEMYEQGWRSDLGITARRKWPLGPSNSGG